MSCAVLIALQLLQGLHRLAMDKFDAFGEEHRAGDLVLEGCYYSFMKLDGALTIT